MKAPTTARQVIPHRGTMLLLDRITEYRRGFARGCTTIQMDHPFLDTEGALEPVVLLELLAQTAAALKGCEAKERGEPPRIGYLAGVRGLEIIGPARAGETLDSEVHHDFSLETVSVLTGSVRRGAQDLAVATLKVWEDPSVSGQGQPDPSESTASRTTSVDFANAPAEARSPMQRAVLDAMCSIEVVGPRRLATGVFSFDESAPAFRGHFPGRPILPAITMVQLALVVGERAAGRRLSLRSIERAKFAKPVRPRDRVCAEVKVTSAERGYLVVATLTRNGDIVGNMTLGTTINRAAEARIVDSGGQV